MYSHLVLHKIQIHTWGYCSPQLCSVKKSKADQKMRIDKKKDKWIYIWGKRKKREEHLTLNMIRQETDGMNQSEFSKYTIATHHNREILKAFTLSKLSLDYWLEILPHTYVQIFLRDNPLPHPTPQNVKTKDWQQTWMRLRGLCSTVFTAYTCEWFSSGRPGAEKRLGRVHFSTTSSTSCPSSLW